MCVRKNMERCTYPRAAMFECMVEHVISTATVTCTPSNNHCNRRPNFLHSYSRHIVNFSPSLRMSWRSYSDTSEQTDTIRRSSAPGAPIVQDRHVYLQIKVLAREETWYGAEVHPG